MEIVYPDFGFNVFGAPSPHMHMCIYMIEFKSSFYLFLFLPIKEGSVTAWKLCSSRGLVRAHSTHTRTRTHMAAFLTSSDRRPGSYCTASPTGRRRHAPVCCRGFPSICHTGHIAPTPSGSCDAYGCT